MSKEINDHDSVIQSIENTRPLSAWGKGVKNAAIDLIGTLEGREITEYNLLNGASNWLHYSEGGCALIYNADIAEAYCTPSELKRFYRAGKNLAYECQPNSKETWIQLQARALSQACRLILKNC